MDCPGPSETIRKKWDDEQNELKNQLVEEDAFDWGTCGNLTITRIGGVDISFLDDGVSAVACIVVLDYPSLDVVYEKMQEVKLTAPYIAGYLAFREVSFLVDLLNELKSESPALVPQVIMVDGNGKLHPKGFGLACHLGVLGDIPTIGIGKNFLVVDSMDMKDVKNSFRENCKKAGDFYLLKGESGTIWGAALQPTDSVRSPIFVSIGHKLCLESAIAITSAVSNFRIPEPVRQADLRSRDYIRKKNKAE